jgi:hypothetical protein
MGGRHHDLDGRLVASMTWWALIRSRCLDLRSPAPRVGLKIVVICVICWRRPCWVRPRNSAVWRLGDVTSVARPKQSVNAASREPWAAKVPALQRGKRDFRRLSRDSPDILLIFTKPTGDWTGLLRVQQTRREAEKKAVEQDMQMRVGL